MKMNIRYVALTVMIEDDMDNPMDPEELAEEVYNQLEYNMSRKLIDVDYTDEEIFTTENSDGKFNDLWGN